LQACDKKHKKLKIERAFAWLGRNKWLSKDYEYKATTSESMTCLGMLRLRRIGSL
jgi:hypothetical protein